MSLPKVHIRLTCIYARKDQYIQQSLSSHLERLHLEEHLDAVHFMQVTEEAFAEHRFTKEEREADIYLVLLSPHLMATPFSHSAYLKKIIANHQFGNVKLLPILLADGDYSKTILGRLERLTSNQLPVRNTEEYSLEANLTLLVEELKLVIIDWRDKKRELVGRWQEAEQAHERQYYENFLKDYPHSIYKEAAEKRFRELKEQDLWKTAKTFDKVHYYYLYLRDAPLKEHRDEALQRIWEIESDEAVAREDVLTSDSIALALDYQIRFPLSQDMEKVEQKIDQMLEERVSHLIDPSYGISGSSKLSEIQGEVASEDEYIKSEAHYLQHLAYKNLTADETLSMELLVRFARQVMKKVRLDPSEQVAESVLSIIFPTRPPVLDNIQSVRKMIILMAVFFSITLFLSGAAVYRDSTQGIVEASLFVNFLLTVVSAFMLIRCFNAYGYINNDLAFCDRSVQDLEKHIVSIRIAYIDHDQRTLYHSTLALRKIEEQYLALESYGILAYLFNRSPKDAKRQKEALKKLPLPLRG